MKETDLITDGWIDSFELLRLISELEKTFGIEMDLAKISPEDFDDVDSIEGMLLKTRHETEVKEC